MNKPLDELIDKHLAGTLLEEEKELLAKMLRVLENQLYLASKIDEKFFDQSLEEVTDDEIGRQLFQRIQQQINEDRLSQAELEDDEQNSKVVHITRDRKRMLRWMAVAAASIILVISVAVLIENKKPHEQQAGLQNSGKSTDSLHRYLVNEINNSGKEKTLQLPDGSMVMLANKSQVTYYEPFILDRQITVKGKAYFKVAKDKTRPFVVISGDISTTALGTEFTVTAFERENRIIVRLYEGKVVVKSVMKGNKNLKKDVYLLPGQEFIYDSNTRVKRFKLDDQAAPDVVIRKEIERDNPSIPQSSQGSWYMFNNQTLEQVLDQLSEIYNVQILYDREDVEKIYFTGRYDRSDSLEFILQEIGTLHDLRITKKDDAFIISR